MNIDLKNDFENDFENDSQETITVKLTIKPNSYRKISVNIHQDDYLLLQTILKEYNFNFAEFLRQVLQQFPRKYSRNADKAK